MNFEQIAKCAKIKKYILIHLTEKSNQTQFIKKSTLSRLFCIKPLHHRLNKYTF